MPCPQCQHENPKVRSIATSCAIERTAALEAVGCQKVIFSLRPRELASRLQVLALDASEHLRQGVSASRERWRAKDGRLRAARAENAVYFAYSFILPIHPSLQSVHLQSTAHD